MQGKGERGKRKGKGKGKGKREKKKARARCPGLMGSADVEGVYRLENWKRRRAPAWPYFFRSTSRESRVRKPALRREASTLGS